MIYEKAKMTNAALMAGIAVIGLAVIFTALSVKADDFMDADTQRARLTEAKEECQIAGVLGADVSWCVSAYLCANYGDCEVEGMQPIEPTPWGVYRDTNK